MYNMSARDSTFTRLHRLLRLPNVKAAFKINVMCSSNSLSRLLPPQPRRRSMEWSDRHGRLRWCVFLVTLRVQLLLMWRLRRTRRCPGREVVLVTRLELIMSIIKLRPSASTKD
ncbi:hypothetical protein HYQ44_009299 [Verticillium longisporum]|nr:hypothetical protein HYQ44_009299 [Verticillium longisporum]